MKKPTRRASVQTTRVNGKRVVIKTSAAGKVEITDAPPLEWELQAAAVRALRDMPGYDSTFALAGDFNAGKRGKQEAAKAKATGLTPGEHDLRIYLAGDKLGLIEFKTGVGRVSPEQRDRHALLARLGFTRQAIIRATTESEAAEATTVIVAAWLAANDNHVTQKQGASALA